MIENPSDSEELLNWFTGWGVLWKRAYSVLIRLYSFQLRLQGLCSLCVQHGRYQSCFQWPLCSQRECGSSMGSIRRSYPLSQTWYSKCLLNYVLLSLLKDSHTFLPSMDFQFTFSSQAGCFKLSSQPSLFCWELRLLPNPFQFMYINMHLPLLFQIVCTKSCSKFCWHFKNKCIFWKYHFPFHQECMSVLFQI